MMHRIIQPGFPPPVLYLRGVPVLFDLLTLLLDAVLTAGTFIFASVGFSLVALDQAIVKKYAVQGDPRARTVPTTTRTLSTQLPGAQIGITLATILLGYTIQSTLADLLSKGLVSMDLAYALASGAAVITATVVINAFPMLFGRLVPKNLTLTYPLKTAGFVVAFQALFTSAIKPLILILNGAANGALRLISIEPQEETPPARLASELEVTLCYSVQEGTIDTSTAPLLMNAIRTSDLATIDVMTDRGHIRIFESTATVTGVVVLSHGSNHFRFPVIGDGLDDTIDLVSLRHTVAVSFERHAEASVVSSSLLAEVPSIPETVPVGSLMVQLCDEGLQMVIVVDEYGGVSRVVTLEDVIEEIVSEVSDKHDGRRRGIHTRSDEQIPVPDLLCPSGFAEHTRITPPEDGTYNTLAGLVMAELGRVAQVSDAVIVEGYTLEVVQMQGRRITQIAIVPPETAEEEEMEL